MIWKTRRYALDLTQQSVVMGILNTTPDSFSDGGKYEDRRRALRYALEMVRDGAQIIDIGGESTRPGAAPVSMKEEIQRTVPLISSLREASDVLISIDTSKAEVASAAIEAGADIVNDVTGLTSDPAMMGLCVGRQVGVCVMHMQGTPQTMQNQPDYGSRGVVEEVKAFFEERYTTLLENGMEAEKICFDPGIGFGKTLEDNLALLRHLDELQQKRPLLLGVSRKSMLGALTGEDSPESRDVATIAVTVMARQLGVRLHRVHDVRGNLQALHIADVLNGDLCQKTPHQL